MADAHGGITRSYVPALVAVKPAVVLATSPYSDDQTREREVGDATVVAAHERAQSSVALHGLSGDGDVKIGFTLAQMVALVGRGGRAAHGGPMGKVDCGAAWAASATGGARQWRRRRSALLLRARERVRRSKSE